MTIKLLYVVAIMQLPVLALAQIPRDSIAIFPLELDLELRGHQGKMVLDSIVGRSTGGAHAYFRIGFKHAKTQKWVWLYGRNIPISAKGFLMDAFQISLDDEYKLHEMDFLRELFEPTMPPRMFKWKCDCLGELPTITF